MLHLPCKTAPHSCWNVAQVALDRLLGDMLWRCLQVADATQRGRARPCNALSTEHTKKSKSETQSVKVEWRFIASHPRLPARQFRAKRAKLYWTSACKFPTEKCCETLSWLVKSTAAVWSWNNASLGKGPMSILQASVAKGEQFHLRFNNSETADIHSTSFYIVLIESHCSHSCYLMRWLTYTRQYQDGQYRLYRTIRNCWAFRPGSHHLSRIEAAYNLASEKPALQANNVFHQRTFG